MSVGIIYPQTCNICSILTAFEKVDMYGGRVRFVQPAADYDPFVMPAIKFRDHVVESLHSKDLRDCINSRYL